RDRVARVEREPAPAFLQPAAQRGARLVGDGHLRSVADQQIAVRDAGAILIILVAIDPDAVEIVDRLGEAQPREIEIMIAPGTPADEIGDKRLRHWFSPLAKPFPFGLSEVEALRRTS